MLRSVQRWGARGTRAVRGFCGRGGRRRRPGRARHSSRSWRRSWAKGPAAHGWEDQRWTPERVKTVTGRPFHLAYTIRGVHKLLVRNGWSCQVPARRAVERTAASPRPA
ncbi:winged helix-turn-helix domain-containing protein [Streptomyces sp. NPDC057557]|uniref:helix-turn-helix domain-containing protein n=1 Tax=Streptomyces sp. NPDC057557 TaxID=3346167 RepID=UPI003688E015